MSAADFLFTSSMQRMLTLVFADPKHSFTLNELLAQAGGGRGGGQRQIERLLLAGVLHEGPRRARQRSIKANTDFFLYPELRGIVLKSFGLAEPLRKALQPFRSHIDEAFVFGSVAKGTDTHNSDIDLIVVGEAPLMAMTEAMLQAGNALGRPVHLNLYAADEWARLKQTDPVLAQISDASGFTTTKINSGKSQNKGIEMMLNLVPVKTSDLQWDFTFTGAYNITKVLSLLTETPGENITVGSHVFNGFVQQIVGQEMGQIVGYGYRRDDGSINPDHAGMIVYGANGLPLPTTKLIPFGSALPKWVGGFTNAVNYKGILVSFLIDFKLGGKVLSGTNFNAYRHGLLKETLIGREGGALDASGNDPGKVIGEGVDINSNINTASSTAQNYYSVVRGSGIIEPVIYNAGYWKLRQIMAGYDFIKFLKGSSAIKGLRLSFVANNVLLLKKWVPNIDPESFSYTSDNVVGLESPSLPTTRSIGFNLNVKF